MLSKISALRLFNTHQTEAFVPGAGKQVPQLLFLCAETLSETPA